MKTDFAVLVTKNLYCYHLIGLDMNLLFNVHNRSIVFTESETGVPLNTIEVETDMTFDEFVLAAKKMYIQMVDNMGGSLDEK